MILIGVYDSYTLWPFASCSGLKKWNLAIALQPNLGMVMRYVPVLCGHVYNYMPARSGHQPLNCDQGHASTVHVSPKPFLLRTCTGQILRKFYGHFTCRFLKIEKGRPCLMTHEMFFQKWRANTCEKFQRNSLEPNMTQYKRFRNSKKKADGHVYKYNIFGRASVQVHASCRF